jgi:hypothetical protein
LQAFLKKHLSKYIYDLACPAKVDSAWPAKYMALSDQPKSKSLMEILLLLLIPFLCALLESTPISNAFEYWADSWTQNARFVPGAQPWRRACDGPYERLAFNASGARAIDTLVVGGGSEMGRRGRGRGSAHDVVICVVCVVVLGWLWQVELI